MKTVEIKICDSCKGKGYVDEDILIDYHKREYETKRKICHSCKGSGRRKYTTTTTVEPFIP